MRHYAVEPHGQLLLFNNKYLGFFCKLLRLLRLLAENSLSYMSHRFLRARLGTLEGGLQSLRDALLGAYRVVIPEIDPLYYLCLQLCNCL
jgi:hypothetical protein